MKSFFKRLIKDSPVEPPIRWMIKRSHGIRMPYDLVINEIYDRQASEIISCVLDVSSNAVDVGCHKGQYLREILKNAPDGCHFAFEPIPELAQVLRDDFPSVDVRSNALSDKPGDTTFFVIPEAPALSGLDERKFVSPDLIRKAITVTTARLDDSIPSGLSIRLIKIDVEGAEGLVLSGARETITRNRPYIIFEHGSASSDLFGVSSASIYQMLVSFGLEVSTLNAWLSGAPPLTLEAFGKGGGWYYLAHPESRKHA